MTHINESSIDFKITRNYSPVLYKHNSTKLPSNIYIFMAILISEIITKYNVDKPNQILKKSKRRNKITQKYE